MHHLFRRQFAVFTAVTCSLSACFAADEATLRKTTVEAQQAYLSRNYDLAEAKYKEALAQSTKLAPKVQSVLMSNLGAVYREAHKYAEADETFRRAVSFAEKSGLAQDPSTRQTMKQYALLLRRMKRTAEADAMELRSEGRQTTTAYSYGGTFVSQPTTVATAEPKVTHVAKPRLKSVDVDTVPISEIKEEITHNPNNADAWMALAYRQKKDNDWGAAAATYRSIVQKFRGKEAQARSGLTWSLYKGGQFTDAIDECKRLIELTPEDGDVYRIMSVCYSRVGDVRNKLAVDELFVEKFPGHPDHSAVSQAMPYLKRDVEKLGQHAQAVEPTEDEQRKCWFRYAKMPLKVYVHDKEDDSVQFSPSQSMITENTPGEIIHRALTAWTEASQGRVSFVLTANQEDANICCFFTKDQNGLENDFAAGITKWELQAGTKPQAKVYVLTMDRDESKPVDRGVFYETLLHEFGHALGLDHSDSTQDVMYRAVHPTPILNLSDVDQARIVKLYTRKT